MHQKAPGDVPSIKPLPHVEVAVIKFLVASLTPTSSSQARKSQVTPQHSSCIQTASHHNLGQASGFSEGHTLGAYPATGPNDRNNQ